MDIKVLGAGCANCNKLEQMVFDVLAELNVDANVTHVTDFKEIMSYGVMSTSPCTHHSSCYQSTTA